MGDTFYNKYAVCHFNIYFDFELGSQIFVTVAGKPAMKEGQSVSVLNMNTGP